jgi:hypothetical protein
LFLNPNQTISHSFLLQPIARQDWVVNATLSSQNSSGWTTIYASRALDSGDATQDRIITPGPNRIIIAWGSSDTVCIMGIQELI